MRKPTRAIRYGRAGQASPGRANGAARAQARACWIALPRNVVALLATWLVVALDAGTVAASPLDLYGFGGRSSAMAGAGLVTSSDVDAVMLNPAGLGLVGEKKFTTGYLYADLKLNLEGTRRPVEPAKGYIVAATTPLGFSGVMRDRLTLALGFYLPASSLARLQSPAIGQPHFALLETRSQILSANIGLGAWITEHWQAGIGVTALASLTGGIAIEADDLGRFNSTSAQHVVTKIAPIVGGQWTPKRRSNLVVGLAYRGEISSSYDLDVTTDFGVIVPIGLPAIRIAGASQYEPRQVNGEVLWRFRPVKLVTALAWQQWSRFPLMVENTTPNQKKQQSPGFHDTVVARVGVEGELAVARLSRGRQRVTILPRAGAAFLPTPAPEMKAQQSLLDSTRVMMAAGVGSKWEFATNTLTLDVWGQYHGLIPRTHTKDVSLLPANEQPGFDSVDTGGRIWATGVTVGVTL